MTNLDSVLKSRDATQPTKVCALKQNGYDVVFCDVDETGRVIPEKFAEVMTKDTDLVSIMHVNNETGCVNDIKELCETAKRINPNVIFHSDGVQAVGKIKVNIGDLGVDLYSISGHKIHSVKGAAGLYVKDGINLKPIVYGGGQEFGIRSATENVGGILSLAYAVKLAVKMQAEKEKDVVELRNETKEKLEELGFLTINSIEQSSYILCAVMPNVRGEVMLHSLEKYQIYIGTGSACSSKKAHKKLPEILCLTPEFENGIIRISFSRYSTKNDIEYFINAIIKEYDILKKYIS